MGKHCKRQTLMDAADLGLLHYGQIDPLIHFLEEREKKSKRTRFSGTTVLMYLGGMLAISACSLFSTLAVEKWGMLLGFWADAVNAEHYRDFHRWIDWRWLIMELATLLVGALMLWRFRYSFLVMPIAFTLFYMGMDIVPAILAQADASLLSDAGWLLRKKISLVFGGAMLLTALVVDLRTRSEKDYAFWLYLFGLMTFWGALSSLGNGALSGKLFYLAVNLLLILIAAMLSRRVFAVFGGLGVAMVLGELSWSVFKDSFAFVAVLTLIGFGLIGLGMLWSQHEHKISSRLRLWLPNSVQDSLVWRA
ncbi:MAG: DUF2157 domain-containing protein [Burkholderiales bacterium]|nr:DUF2157 domain-containing protein [Burkholderiales bacterium]